MPGYLIEARRELSFVRGEKRLNSAKIYLFNAGINVFKINGGAGKSAGNLLLRRLHVQRTCPEVVN